MSTWVINYEQANLTPSEPMSVYSYGPDPGYRCPEDDPSTWTTLDILSHVQDSVAAFNHWDLRTLPILDHWSNGSSGDHCPPGYNRAWAWYRRPESLAIEIGVMRRLTWYDEDIAWLLQPTIRHGLRLYGTLSRKL